MTCATCRWWQKAPDTVERMGECRLIPPKPIRDSYHNGYWGRGNFPVTNDTDWCGCWRDKPLTSTEGLSTMPPSPTGTQAP